MKTTTESDIPQLFRQFSGNAANYQELTRAAAARASQARWPLLSAVELEQGDIPAVIDRETGLVVLDASPLRAKSALVEPAADDATAAPFVVLTEIIPDTATTTGEFSALANDEGVSLSKDEILALIDIEAQDAHETPVPVILPGTNTIFMPPATFSARHFAQVERALAARREAALSGTPAQAGSAEAPRVDDEAEAQLVAAEAVVAVVAVAEHLPAVTAAPSNAADDTLAALTEELAAALPREATASATEFAKAEMPPATIKTPTVATESGAKEPAVSTASATPTPSVVDATPSNQPMPVVAPLQSTTSTASTPAPVPAAQALPARPVSTSLAQLAASMAVPTPPKPAAQPLLRAPAASAVATQTPAAPTVESTVESTVKHAGLKPLFERLAAPEETATPVMSLFSRLLQS